MIQSLQSGNQNSILFHLDILDEESEINKDLSEYPC
jgi:hypothetical protein